MNEQALKRVLIALAVLWIAWCGWTAYQLWLVYQP